MEYHNFEQVNHHVYIQSFIIYFYVQFSTFKYPKVIRGFLTKWDPDLQVTLQSNTKMAIHELDEGLPAL